MSDSTNVALLSNVELGAMLEACRMTLSEAAEVRVRQRAALT